MQITSAYAHGLNWRVESVTERFISILPTVKETRFFFTINGVSDRFCPVTQTTNQRHQLISLSHSPGAHPLTIKPYNSSGNEIEFQLDQRNIVEGCEVE